MPTTRKTFDQCRSFILKSTNGSKTLPLPPCRQQGREEDSSYSFLTSMGVSGKGHALAALYPWGNDPRYPMDRRLDGSQRTHEAGGKILCLCWDRTQVARVSSLSSDTILTELPQFTVHRSAINFLLCSL
jgi:hypothetical protein